jgi:hypothetical protein
VDVVYGTEEGYQALGIPTWRTHRAACGVTWRTKSDAVIVGAGAGIGVRGGCRRAGKKVVVPSRGRTGADLVSRFRGRRIKTAGAPFLLEGKNAFGYSRVGVGGAARCITSRTCRASAERLR